MLLITEINASFLHIFGKIVKGSTDVASVTVLKAVRIIQINGTSIVMDTMISMTCIKIVVNFFFVSIGYTLFTTELSNRPIDGNPSHDRDNSTLLFASIYIEDSLKCTSHNPCFLFGAKLNHESHKGRTQTYAERRKIGS